MIDKKDPLESLFTSDAKATERHQLASLVKPFLSIDQNSREFNFLPAFSKINGNMAKVEILLAGAKARSLHLKEPDGLLPGDIIATGVIAEGSVKSSLKKLFDNHKIKRDKEGRYFIPAYRIPELIKQFNKQL